MRENIKSLKKNTGELEGGRVVALVIIGLYHMLTVLQKSVGSFEYRIQEGNGLILIPSLYWDWMAAIRLRRRDESACRK
jgi:hypothetical protein